jgi:hypothetical protein
MAAASLNEIYKAIGALTEAVKNVDRRLEDFEKEQAANAVQANTHRATLHKRMDEIVDRTGKLEGQMSSAQKDIGKVKEVTDKVTMWEQRGIGALAITGFGASAVTFAITHWWNEILTLLRHG